MQIDEEEEKIQISKDLSKNKKQRIFLILFIIFYPSIIVFLMDFIQRYAFDHPILSTFGWVFSFPVAFLVNWLIIFLMTAFIWLLTKKTFIATALVSIFSVFCSLINYFKLSIRGEPIYPSDVLFPSEALKIAGSTKLIIPENIIVFFVITIILVVLSVFIKPPDMRFKKRILFAVIIIVFSGLSFPLYFTNTGVQKLIGINDAIWSQKYNYENNGFFNAFLMQSKYLRVSKPSGYNRNIAEKILTDNAGSKILAETPNIIYIMNESFWDPTLLPGVKYNIDPLEEFRQIQKESIYGNLLVEPFGGNTANTEFEALTGFSMNNLPGGVAYQQYVRRELPSLPTLLISQGYSVEAIHPYYPWFWNRDKAYPLLGIDKFLDAGSFSDENYKGKFVSDKDLGKKIIKEFEENESTGKPFFAHIVTMQNHGSYDKKRYGSNQKIHITSNKIDKETLSELEVYSQGIKDASANLEQLVEYFSKVDKPTIIVFYGDHLPTLGENYGAYRSTGFISKNSNLSDKDQYKIHSNPFLIWSNTSSQSQNIGTINSNFLTPTVLKYGNVAMSNYFSFLNNQMDDVKACNKTVCLDKNGKYISNKSDSIKKILNKQAILQYYYMFD